MLTSLVRQGHISHDDMADPAKAAARIAELLKSKPEIHIILHHADSLAKLGDRFLRENKPEYARLFYATCFEHLINSALTTAIDRRKLPEKVRVETLRAVPLAGKLTWLPALLGLPAFNATHRKTILGIADKRNAFVHYKYLPDPDDGTDRADSESVKKEMAAAKRAIAYARRYEAIAEFGYKKGQLRSSIKRFTAR